MRRLSLADKSLYGLAVAAALALCIAGLAKMVPAWIIAIYAVTSLISLTAYGCDKSYAEKGTWRIPESTLHFFALIGGWPGGLVAQRLFRHKTRKLSFQLVFWLIVLLHLAGWGWLIAQRK